MLKRQKGCGEIANHDGLSRTGQSSSRKALIGGFLLFMVLLAGFAMSAVADQTLSVGGHTFEYLGVTYNDDGTSTWTYRVTSGRKPSLSHWVLEFDPSLKESNIVNASEDYTVGNDPSTELYGIKFDEGYKDNETRDVFFILDDWYALTDTRVGIKAGKDAQVDASLTGPAAAVIVENEPPEANDDAATTDENNPVNIDITANDIDSDGAINKTTVTITKDPGNGSLGVYSTTGVVSYTPDPGFCGSDCFKYTVDDDDGATSNEATVQVTVICNESPQAGDDGATTDENTSIGIDVPANDTDNDGTIDRETVTITKNPEGGSVSVHRTTGVITYIPNLGSCGSDTFQYTIDDNDGATSNEAVVTVNVLCNDPPLAIDDLYSVREGEMLDIPASGILTNDVDSPGSLLTTILISNTEHGSLSLNTDGSFNYIHDGSETSGDSFTYKASDGVKDSNVALVSIVINPTNDQPMAEDDSAATDEDEPVIIDVLSNDSDPDGDTLSVDWVTQPSNGTASKNGSDVTYMPDPDFNGVDTFTYTASDGSGGAATATVTVSVATVNDPPLAQDDSSSTEEDTPVTILVLSNDSDPDGDDLSVGGVTQPANGTASNNGNNVTYIPDTNFNGVDTFTYTASDGDGTSASAMVTVAVAMVNDPPVAQDDSTATNEDTPVTIRILANDTDPDGDNLVIESSTQPLHGATARSGTNIIYTPAPTFNGADTFTYTIADGNGGTAMATVRVAVMAVNDSPLAQDDSHSTGEDTPITIPVLAKLTTAIRMEIVLLSSR
jgi:VCBS repeat-containing protein